MHYKKRIVIPLLSATLILLSTLIPAFAANKAIIKKATFTSYTSNFSYSKFDNTISENGKKYNLSNVDYKILNKENVINNVTKTSFVEDYVSNSVAVGDEIQVDGKTVVATSVNPSETILTNRIAPLVTYDIDSGYVLEEPNFNKSCVINYQDEHSGKTIPVTVKYVSDKIINDYKWVNDVQMPIVIENYNGRYYMIGDAVISATNVIPDLENNKQAILDYLGLKNTQYRIINYEWNGDPYTNDEGIMCRNIVANVERYVAIYNGHYEATNVSLPDCSGYKIAVDYKENEKSNSEYEYTVEALATYSPLNTMTVGKAVLIGICALVVILLIAGLIYIIKNKNDKDETDKETLSQSPELYVDTGANEKAENDENIGFSD